MFIISPNIIYINLYLLLLPYCFYCNSYQDETRVGSSGFGFERNGFQCYRRLYVININFTSLFSPFQSDFHFLFLKNIINLVYYNF